MGTVGLAMIVKDEPVDRLAMLTEYLRPVVSKFVIADTGSVEPWTDMCNTWDGVTAYDFEWVNDFAAARNSTLEHLKDVDWVLHLDGDELPSRVLLDHINWIKDNAPKKVLGYRFWTLNYWGGIRGGEAEYHWHCRMFRQGRGEWYKPVHEQVKLNGMYEYQAEGNGTLIKADKAAYLIHSKPAERLARANEVYAAIGEGEVR